MNTDAPRPTVLAPSPLIGFERLATAREDLALVVMMTLLLNLADAIFTLIWVEMGMAQEANPIMGYLLGISPLAFVVTKLAMVSAGTALLWHFRSRTLAQVALFVAFLAYYAVLMVHVQVGLGS